MSLLGTDNVGRTVRLHGRTGAAPMIADPALVFDSVTVIDVEHGTRLPNQRVVIVGTRIKAMGPLAQVEIPKSAQVVNAAGKYLIPGLWDMHIHVAHFPTTTHATVHLFYQTLLVNGVTGFRDAAMKLPLDTMRKWREEILAGRYVGPPRQLFSGPGLDGPDSQCEHRETYHDPHVCFVDVADGLRVVDSLKAAGADVIKTYDILPAKAYYAIAAEARRIGIPFGGHINTGLDAITASDSGMRFLDHNMGGLDTLCYVNKGIMPTSRNVAICRTIGPRFVKNNTWVVPTIAKSNHVGTSWGGPRDQAIYGRFRETVEAEGSVTTPWDHWLQGPPVRDTINLPAPDSIGSLRFLQQFGLPIVAGTDVANLEGAGNPIAGFDLHMELAMYVAGGITPLAALQTATLNPAKAMQMTDSLGTVAIGKLADLVLLDADPLTDITNTTTIRAVVANGRYFDRAALERLMADIRARWTP